MTFYQMSTVIKLAAGRKSYNTYFVDGGRIVRKESVNQRTEKENSSNPSNREGRLKHGNTQSLQFSSVQLLNRVRLFATPWTAARQFSLSITISQTLLKVMSIELVMPSSHLILCHPLLLLPSIFPSIRVFSSESALHIRWPKDWSFSFSISIQYREEQSHRVDCVPHGFGKWMVEWDEQ